MVYINIVRTSYTNVHMHAALTIVICFVLGKPPCPKVKAYAIAKKTMAAVAVTWEENDRIPVTNTLVRYCPSTSPNCSTTVACTQGRGTGCILYGLDTEKWYIFTVTANNNCGAATGCKENVYIAITKHKPTGKPI